MSPLARRFLRTAAACLVVGLLVGLWALARRELLGEWPHPLLVSAHVHLLVVGGIVHTIVGTALWLFPRPRPGDPRVRPWHGEAAWWGLAGGTALRAGGEIARTAGSSASASGIVLVGAVLQLAGVGAALLALRPRVRGSASRPV